MFLYNIIETGKYCCSISKSSIEKKICKKYNYKYTQYFSRNISEYGENVEATLRQYCSNINCYSGNIAAVLLNRGGNIQKNVVVSLTFLSCY